MNTNTTHQEVDISNVLQKDCKLGVTVKNVNEESPVILQEKYPEYLYYNPDTTNKHLFETKEYLKSVKGTAFADGATLEEKQKTQMEIDTQFLKDVPRTTHTLNSINMLDLYSKYQQENISPDLQTKITTSKSKEEYLGFLEPLLPKIRLLSEEEKTSLFELKSTQDDLNMVCFLPWFDNYMLEKMENSIFHPISKPSLNDIKILSQQGVNSDILSLVSCYYTQNLPDVVCLDLTKNSIIPPIFLEKLNIDLKSDSTLICDIKMTDDNIKWFWQKQFILASPTNNLFTLAKIIGSTYIDWNTRVYFLWKTTWLNPSIEQFFRLIQTMNDNEQNNNNYTGGTTQPETENATKNLIVEMEKYVFNEQFNEKFPKNLEALVQYFTNTMKNTSTIKTINEYMKKVQNINNAIKAKLDNPNATDADIIDFTKASNPENLNTNTVQNVEPQETSSLQKIKNIGSNLGENISTQASNLTKKVKENAINVSTAIKNKASQVSNVVNEGLNTLSNTTNVSGKMVVTNEAVTLGSIIAGIALMAPLLIVGGSKKRKNMKKKKYTKKRNVIQKQEKKHTKKRTIIQKKKKNYTKTKKENTVHKNKL